MFGDDWRVDVYFWAQIVGGTGLTLLLLTMLWPNAKKRNPVLISLCFSWWLSTFPCLLLLYYAGEVAGPAPRHSICLASASLTIAQSPLTAVSATSLVFHIWFTMRDAVDPKGPLSYRSSLETISLVIMPYLCFAITALTTVLVGFLHPSSVHRVLFYCIVDIPALEMAVSIVCLVALVVAAIFGSWTSILLARNCTSVREHGVDFTFMLRVFAFGLYVVLGLCLNGLAISDWTSPLPDLFLSTFSIIVCLIFGSQRDILITWQDGVAQCVTSLFSCCLSFACKLSSLNRRGHGHLTPRIDIMVDVQTATQTSHGSSSFATLTPYPFHLQSQRCEKGSDVFLARSVGRAMDGNGSGSLCNATPTIPGTTSPNSARDLSS